MSPDGKGKRLCDSLFGYRPSGNVVGFRDTYLSSTMATSSAKLGKVQRPDGVHQKTLNALSRSKSAAPVPDALHTPTEKAL